MITTTTAAARAPILTWLAVGFFATTGLSVLQAQEFDSGSDESDGDLTFVGTGTTILDPVALGIDPDGDNVFHFTTVTIPVGHTVRLRTLELGGDGKAVVFLCSGDVEIAGILDLNGDGGHGGGGPFLDSVSGAGGFSGGKGRDGSVGDAADRGNGPGGGDAPAGGAGHRTVGGGTTGGDAYGNRFLLPLIGGSGGAGGTATGTSNGSGGGAGGGAICIASSTSIAVTGTIRASGGGAGGGVTFGTAGGGGSPGAIRLVAPAVTGTGSIQLYPGFGAGSGRVRIESFQRARGFTGSIVPASDVLTEGTPGHVLPPASAPSVRITSVDRVSVPAQTTGSTATPDVTIDNAEEITIEISASNVPLGTTVSLLLYSEDADPVKLTSTALEGSLDASTASAGPVVLPSGFTRIVASADWTP